MTSHTPIREGSQNVFDNFVFTALPTGAQKIRLDFWAPEGINPSYAAGGKILYGAKPIRSGWEGKELGEVKLYPKTGPAAFTLLLGDDFKGVLYLALNFTYPDELNYAIGVPSNGPSPVPLPAGVLLIGSALGGLALVRARSRRKPA